jgi:hypothetical protein
MKTIGRNFGKTGLAFLGKLDAFTIDSWIIISILTYMVRPGGLMEFYMLRSKILSNAFRGYVYTQTGLSYHFEKNNVLQKLDLNDKKKQKKEIKEFEEFNHVGKDEYIVTIEHCSNCEDHQTHTHHSTDTFRNIATYLQKSIIMRFPFIKVLLKPIDTCVLKDFTKTHKVVQETKILDNKFNEVRIGAFEVRLVVNR